MANKTTVNEEEYEIQLWYRHYRSFLAAGGASPGISMMSLLFGCTSWITRGNFVTNN